MHCMAKDILPPTQYTYYQQFVILMSQKATKNLRPVRHNRQAFSLCIVPFGSEILHCVQNDIILICKSLRAYAIRPYDRSSVFIGRM
jgi:hypothetical protein